jgi:hypothetical protein
MIGSVTVKQEPRLKVTAIIPFDESASWSCLVAWLFARDMIGGLTSRAPAYRSLASTFIARPCVVMISTPPSLEDREEAALETTSGRCAISTRALSLLLNLRSARLIARLALLLLLQSPPLCDMLRRDGHADMLRSDGHALELEQLRESKSSPLAKRSGTFVAPRSAIVSPPSN